MINMYVWEGQGAGLLFLTVFRSIFNKMGRGAGLLFLTVFRTIFYKMDNICQLYSLAPPASGMCSICNVDYMKMVDYKALTFCRLDTLK